MAGRTEIVTNSQDPNFTAQFTITYIFEEVQSLRLEVYDADSSFKTNDATKLPLHRQDFQGTIVVFSAIRLKQASGCISSFAPRLLLLSRRWSCPSIAPEKSGLL